MNMKKYHSHTLLYLHETIDLGSGRSDRFTEVFSDVYQPMMEELGARLFAIWETTPFNGHWPQVTSSGRSTPSPTMRASGGRSHAGGSHEAPFAKWTAFLSEIGASGEGRIMYAGRSNKTLAQLKDENFTAGLVIQEIMQSKPGRQDDYIRELERLYVPWSESTGKMLARLVHHHVPVQRGHPLLGARGRLGLLRKPLPVMEREPACRDRHLDERRARTARRLGGLDPAGATTVTAAMNTPVLQDFSYDPFDRP